jgi:hypothetical protein
MIIIDFLLIFRMNALSDALPKIDFGYYRKMVTDPSLVDKLQKEVRINFVLF